MPRIRKMRKSFEQMISAAEALSSRRGTSRKSEVGQKRFRKEDDKIESQPTMKKQKTCDQLSYDQGEKDSPSRRDSSSKKRKRSEQNISSPGSQNFVDKSHREKFQKSPTSELVNANKYINENDCIDDLLGDKDYETKTKLVQEPSNPIVDNPEGSPQSFKCLECEKTFGMNEDKYKAHKMLDHPFKCKLCHLKFTLRSKLDDHQSDEHPWEIMFEMLDRQVQRKKMSFSSPEPQAIVNEIPKVTRNQSDLTSSETKQEEPENDTKSHAEEGVNIDEKAEQKVTSPSTVKNPSRGTGS